jgi:predicted ferric reductase
MFDLNSNPRGHTSQHRKHHGHHSNRRDTRQEYEHTYPEPSNSSWKVPGWILGAALAGVFASLYILPAFLPAMATSMTGSQPKVFWYLSRGSGIVAFWMLWLSMVFGLLLTGKVARWWPGAPQSLDLHQFTSLLGLGLATFHGLILTGDHFINYTLAQVLIPFAGQGYRPFWVGIGQVAFYISAIVTFSFYVRKRIGARTWRLLHYASFLGYAMVMVHAVTSGTDSQAAWAVFMYWASGGILLFLVAYRVLVSLPFFSGKKRSSSKTNLAEKRPSTSDIALQPVRSDDK